VATSGGSSTPGSASGPGPGPGDASATAAITMPAISVNKMMTAGVAIFNDRQLVKPESASRPQEATVRKAHLAGGELIVN